MISLTQTRMLDGSRFIRCVAISRESEFLLRGEAARHGYRVFVVDFTGVQTKNDLMSEIAGVLNFPSYFGRNWDALLDMVTDLSWMPAVGYVLLFKNAAALLRLPGEDAAIFVRLCSAAVRHWQSGEDEAGKTIPRTPVYFLFEEQASFCRLVADLKIA